MRYRQACRATAMASLAVVATVAFGQEPTKPDYSYKSAVTKGAQPATRQMYRTVDDKGRVVYSDAPKEAGQKAAKINNSVNVATPEARRQLEIDLQNRSREEQAERSAAIQRNAPIRQREAEEAYRKRREAEAQNPEYAPRPIRIQQY
jgi:hypothetical protein